MLLSLTNLFFKIFQCVCVLVLVVIVTVMGHALGKVLPLTIAGSELCSDILVSRKLGSLLIC